MGESSQTSSKSDIEHHLFPQITRRTVLKSFALGGLGAVAGGISLPFVTAPVARAVEAVGNKDEKVLWSACTVNCGSRCALRMHVSDDVIRWVETDNSLPDEYGAHQVRACLRGRSMRRRVYNPDRLKYPMLRVGKRGEGKFKRITWDEAFDLLAENIKSIYQNDLKPEGNSGKCIANSKQNNVLKK